MLFLSKFNLLSRCTLLNFMLVIIFLVFNVRENLRREFEICIWQLNF